MSFNKRIDQLAPRVAPVVADEIALWDSTNTGTRKISLLDLAALIGSGSFIYEQTMYHTVASTGNSVTIAALINKTITLLLLGGIGSGEIITSGTPTGNQIKFDNTTGTFSKASGENFFTDEILTIKYV